MLTAAVLLVPSTPAAPQEGEVPRALVEVVERDRSPEPAPSIDELAVIRAGAVTEETVSPDETRLFAGDEIRARAGTVTVGLDCGGARDESDPADDQGNSLLIFSGTFRVVMLPAGAVSCAFDLLSGTAYVMTDEETETHLGEITAGSRHTYYGVRLVRAGGRLVREVSVFDGTVEVSSRTGTEARRNVLEAGRKLGVDGAVARIEGREYTRVASTIASVDMARTILPAAERATAYDNLLNGYLRVLRDPEDPSARMRLAAQQLHYSTASWTTLYQLEQAEARQPVDTSGRVALDLVKGLVYEQLGDPARARAQYEKVQQDRDGTDDETVGRYLLQHRFSEETLRQIYGSRYLREVRDIDTRQIRPGGLRRPTVAGAGRLPALTVEARATPAAVAAGSRTRIIVAVSDTEGQPVAGASVRVQAGGGSFRGGGSQADGTTDANGRFVTTWYCSRCGPRYHMDVTVTREGHADASTSLNVTVTRVRPR